VVAANDIGLFPPVRRLVPGDLKRCLALAADRGWSPEKAKWSLLLDACEPFGVDAPDGRGLAGAVVLTRWGTDRASVGMMLVATRYGRRGLGRTLMEHLIGHAEDATVTLFATDMGRPLYEKLGFLPVRRSVSFVGTFRPDRSQDNSKRRFRFRATADAGAGTGTGAQTGATAGTAATGTARPATEADLAAILAVDAAAFGADRGNIVRRLPGFAERIAVLETGAGSEAERVTGYATAWRNGPSTTIIGPVIAPDAEAASRLIAYLAGQVRGNIRLDLDPDRPELPSWAHAHGLEPVSRTTVMAHEALGALGANNDQAPRGTPDHLFAPISVALA
jgi:GNAT superfamily N-acetyltransferase